MTQKDFKFRFIEFDAEPDFCGKWLCCEFPRFGYQHAHILRLFHKHAARAPTYHSAAGQPMFRSIASASSL